MSDPERMRDDPDAPPELRRMLSAAREQRAPEAARAQVLAGVLAAAPLLVEGAIASAAAPQAAAGGAGAGAGASAIKGGALTAAWIKGGAAVLMLTGAGVGVGTWLPRSTPEAATAAHAPPPSTHDTHELREPSEAAPSEAVPSEAAPSEAVPSEAAPSEAVPSEAAPSEAAPSEAAPNEAAPSEAAPSETARSQVTPKAHRSPRPLHALLAARPVARPASPEPRPAPLRASVPPAPSETPDGVGAARPSPAEATLLLWARAKLRASEPDAAHALLDRVDRSYPNGQFEQERLVLRISAFQASGNLTAARRLAVELRRRFPDSPHLGALRGLLDTSGPSSP